MDYEELLKLKGLKSEDLRRHIEHMELQFIKLSPAIHAQIRSIVGQMKQRGSSADRG
jgi:hypothetical protein